MLAQLKKINLLGLCLVTIFSFLLTSCAKEESTVSSENFVDQTIQSLQERSVGKSQCLEFVFPVTIEFVDGSTAEVTSYENMHETIIAWFEENDVERTRENKPQLVFPIQVINQEGEMIDVDSKETLRALKRECRSEGPNRPGKGGRGFHCFSLVFPVSLNVGEEVLTFEDKQSLKEAVRAYKESAGEEAVRPTFVYPITVELEEDESTLEINSQEELDALKEDCKE